MILSETWGGVEKFEKFFGLDAAAGEIVALGILVGIARADIPVNTLGALAVFGVFDVK